MKKLLLSLIVVFLFAGCKKESKPEEVVKLNRIYYSGSEIRYDVVFENIQCTSSPEFGLVWSLNKTPTVESGNKVIYYSYAECVSYASGNRPLDGAPLDKLFYIRAYAKTKTSPGVIYSEEVSFKK